jgi:hypothetical protein
MHNVPQGWSGGPPANASRGTAEINVFTAICELRHPAKLSWPMVVGETACGVLLAAGLFLLLA